MQSCHGAWEVSELEQLRRYPCLFVMSSRILVAVYALLYCYSECPWNQRTVALMLCWLEMTVATCISFSFGFLVLAIYGLSCFLPAYSCSDRPNEAGCMTQTHACRWKACSQTIAGGNIFCFKSTIADYPSYGVFSPGMFLAWVGLVFNTCPCWFTGNISAPLFVCTRRPSYTIDLFRFLLANFDVLRCQRWRCGKISACVLRGLFISPWREPQLERLMAAFLWWIRCYLVQTPE